MHETNGQQPYAAVAAELRKVADQIAQVTVVGRVGAIAYLSFTAGYTERDADKGAAVVDAIAAVLGAQAATKFDGRGANRRGEHRVRVERAGLTVTSYTPVPAPPTRQQKLADLEAENAELRAQLAAKTGNQA